MEKEKRNIDYPFTSSPMLIERRRWITHTIAWGLILGFPLFSTGRVEVGFNWIDYLHKFLVPASFLLVFNINYEYLIDRFLFSKHVKGFLMSNLILIVLSIVTIHLCFEWLPHGNLDLPPKPNMPWHKFVGIFFTSSILYMMVAGLSVAIKMTTSWYKTENARRELEKSQAEAELQNLKSQLNPHFLFNTLNNIYSLISFSPEKAQEAIHDLSRLLRYVLYDSSQPTVPLEKEFDFIQDYIELMRIRLSDQVKVETQITIEDSKVLIAPLLFISLIENAFKHGISPMYPSFISIKLHEKEGKISCTIRNSYFPKDNEQDKSGSGIGLQNLHRRLELLYPTRHTFSHKHEGEEYVCLLELQV